MVFSDFIVHRTSLLCDNDRWLDYCAVVIWGRHAALQTTATTQEMAFRGIIHHLLMFLLTDFTCYSCSHQLLKNEHLLKGYKRNLYFAEFSKDHPYFSVWHWRQSQNSKQVYFPRKQSEHNKHWYPICGASRSTNQRCTTEVSPVSHWDYN